MICRWFAKCFLHPDIVSEYNYIFLWDGNIRVGNFSPRRSVQMIALVFSRAWRCLWYMIQGDDKSKNVRVVIRSCIDHQDTTTPTFDVDKSKLHIPVGRHLRS
ncbi:hypothetical protein AMTRI_Chr06g172500 [Amborella trichopoda]